MPVGASRVSTIGRVGVSIPDSVVYRWENPIDGLSDQDTVSTWPHEIGGIDMEMVGSPIYDESGLNDTPGVDFGDGSEYGELGDVSDFFDVFPGKHAIAYSVYLPENPSDEAYMGTSPGGPNTIWRVDYGRFNASDGAIGYQIRDEDRNNVEINTTDTFDDDDTHFIVINATGISGSDLDIYVDDMENPVDVTVEEDDDLTGEIVDLDGDDAPFLAGVNNDGGDLIGSADMTVGTVSLLNDSLNESERKSLKDEELWT